MSPAEYAVVVSTFGTVPGSHAAASKRVNGGRAWPPRVAAGGLVGISAVAMLLSGCTASGVYASPENERTVSKTDSAATEPGIPRYLVRLEPETGPALEDGEPRVHLAFMDATSGRVTVGGILLHVGAVPVALAMVLVASFSTTVADGELPRCVDTQVAGSPAQICVDEQSAEPLHMGGSSSLNSYATPDGSRRSLPEAAGGAGTESPRAACDGEPFPDRCRLAVTSHALVEYETQLNREWRRIGTHHWRELIGPIPPPDPAARLDRGAATDAHARAVEELAQKHNDPGPDCEAIEALRKSFPFVPAVPCGKIGRYCSTLLVCQSDRPPTIVVSAEEIQVPTRDRIAMVATKHGLKTVSDELARVASKQGALESYLQNATLLFRLVEVGIDPHSRTLPGGYWVQQAPAGDLLKQHPWRWWTLAPQHWGLLGGDFLDPVLPELFDLRLGNPPAPVIDPIDEKPPFQIPDGVRGVIAVRSNLVRPSFVRIGALVRDSDLFMLRPRADRNARFDRGSFSTGWW